MEHYNHERLHAALGYLPPAEYYAGDPAARQKERNRKLEEGRMRRLAANRQLAAAAKARFKHSRARSNDLSEKC